MTGYYTDKPQESPDVKTRNLGQYKRKASYMLAQFLLFPRWRLLKSECSSLFMVSFTCSLLYGSQFSQTGVQLDIQQNPLLEQQWLSPAACLGPHHCRWQADSGRVVQSFCCPKTLSELDVEGLPSRTPAVTYCRHQPRLLKVLALAEQVVDMTQKTLQPSPQRVGLALALLPPSPQLAFGLMLFHRHWPHKNTKLAVDQYAIPMFFDLLYPILITYHSLTCY